MPGVWKLLRTLIYMVVGLRSVSSNSDIWPLERPEGMPAIQSLEVMCGKDHMDVHLSFSQPFEGIVSSKGQHADPRCIYVPPSTGQTFFSFRIAYARCGTKPDMHGQFYENTVVVQYDKDLLEVWDEAKRLRCEWFNDYEKTASKPPMVIADLDVIQLDFRGDNVDCWMEIQHGKGPWAPPVSGIVPLGSTLTLVIAINDYRGEFDMRVKSCVASDGGGHTIQLSDEFGCVLRPKMISRFLKARGSDDRATVITYAFFHAFKFPDALSVHIKCKVEICRHGCLDHCQLSDSVAHYIQERKDQIRPQYIDSTAASIASGDDNSSADKDSEDGADEEQGDSSLYDDVIQNGDEVASIGGHFLDVEKSIPKAQAQTSNQLPSTAETQHDSEVPLDEVDLSKPLVEPPPPVTRYDQSEQDQFPHGPRNLEEDSDAMPATPLTGSVVTARRKRSVTVTDRKARSADVGVSGIYEVISEADLAFSPDAHAEAVTVFQGRIREEVVYGICLPMPGFSALFIIVALSAVVSALVAGAMLHRLQAQREVTASNRESNQTDVHTSNNNGWLSYGLLRVRCTARPAAPHNPEELKQTNAVASQVTADQSVERG
ncbi:Cuticlin-1 [Camponotus japonicus]